MPQLGESVTEGVVARWLKAEGDYVERDESLLEIITDKVNAEMPSPVSGTLVTIVAPEGATVPIGGEIAQIETRVAVAVAAPVSAASAASPAGDTMAADAATLGLPARGNGAGAGASAETGVESEERKRYSPLVKRLAREHDVDLSELDGSGISGRVTKDDVLSFVASRQNRPGATASQAAHAPAMPPVPFDEPTLPEFVAASAPLTPAPAATAEPMLPPMGASVVTPPARPTPPSAPVAVPTPAPASQPRSPSAADEEYVPLTPMRKAIAEHMVRSKHTAPHATTTIEVDMTPLVRWREKNKEAVKARHGVDVTYVPLVMQAVVQALRDFPILNSSWGEDRIIVKRRVHLGVAVGLEDGLVVPVVHDADEKNVVGLARAVVDLVARARNNRLTMGDLQGGTFTVNNTGAFGAIMTTPVINQPQAAILAMNAIVKRPVVIEDDAIAVRSIMTMSLSFDHRVVDGLTAGRFMQRVVHHIDRLDLSSV